VKIQLWSYNYDPEPTGIGVVSTVWARGLLAQGHDVDVVTAHPHYPEPRWGTRLLPYREVRDGIGVLRLPLWIGRASTAERYRQELTFMAAQTAASPFLGRPDVLVSTSPSFPALLPAMASVRMRRIPWVLWLHDVLPDGATATGLVESSGFVVSLARALERAAYRVADRIVISSGSFTDNLVAKGVSLEKLELIHTPATRLAANVVTPRDGGGALRILSMGNIGHSQGLASLVRAFEAHPELTGNARLVITGTGVVAEETRAQIISSRVRMLGLVGDERLERELHLADVGLVSQRHRGAEFNIPSKLMNFMAYGLPVLAVVNPAGEVARIVRESRAGWVANADDPDSFPREVARIKQAGQEISDRAANARMYAERYFTRDRFTAHFEAVLQSVAPQSYAHAS
jgi:colanic acid biosynthesis glycosyl transferase WcaI